MFLRWRLDENGNKIPNAKCPKCKSDAFNTWVGYKCGTCSWWWSPDEDGGDDEGHYDIESKKEDIKIEPSTHFHEKDHNWKWMPISKCEAEEEKDKFCFM